MSIELRIAHLSDSHFRQKGFEEIKRCHNAFLAELLIDGPPDLIVHTGDVFDDRNIRGGSEAAIYAAGFFRSLSHIAPTIVLRGTPSHDGRTPELLPYCRSEYPLEVVDYPVQYLLGAHGSLVPLSELKEYDGSETWLALISALPAPTKEHFYDQAAGIAESDQDIGQKLEMVFEAYGKIALEMGLPHIVLGHWNTSGAFITGSERLTGVDIEVGADQVLKAQPTIVCLGHIHKAQTIRDRIFYAGSMQPLTWGELDQKGWWMHTITDRPEYDPTALADTVVRMEREYSPHYYHVESDFIETPVNRRIRLKLDFTEEGRDIRDVDWPREFEAATQGAPQPLEGMYNKAIVRIDIKLYQDEVARIDEEAIFGYLNSEGVEDVQINLQRVPRAAVRSARIIEVTRLREKLTERARILEEPISDEILDKADQLDDGLVFPDNVVGLAKGGQ
jgi:DNA repair exonuclease SbcCD nuclease subunit